MVRLLGITACRKNIAVVSFDERFGSASQQVREKNLNIKYFL
jgi:hypothetical protein